jgi:hypothetical protein
MRALAYCGAVRKIRPTFARGSTMMSTHFDPQLRLDLNEFLDCYRIADIGDIPIERFAEIDFPVRYQKQEHQALSGLVARLLRLERLRSGYGRCIGSLDERDLVRDALDPSLESWHKEIARPALVRLALLDLRERLPRLAMMAEEEKSCDAIRCLNSERADEKMAVLGKMSALVSWLREESIEIAELTSQVPDLPVELLPQPTWNLYIELQARAEELDSATDACQDVDELDYLDAYLAQCKQLDAAIGSLSTYDPIFDSLDDDFSAFNNPAVTKYRPVRRILERGVALLNVDHEQVSGEWISPDSIQPAIDEAFRLTDAENAIWEFIGSDIFRPEDWKANRDALVPLKLLRPQTINFELRAGVMELSHAFVFGHWASVQALSRALLEQAIKLNCERLGIDLRYTYGKKEYKSLESFLQNYFWKNRLKFRRIMMNFAAILGNWVWLLRRVNY